MSAQTPQLENGYIRIATDIAKYLAQTYMSSYESQVMWSIFIKTYGFKKKEDWISNSQFVSLTKMHKAHVSRTIKKLILRRIVTQTGNKIAFQKDAALWCELPKQVTVTQTGNSVAHLGNKELPKQADTIDTLTKDTIQKILATKVANLNESLSLFKGVNPSYERLFSNKTQRAALERMIAKYGEPKVKNMLAQLPSIVSKPYAPQISTPLELESKLGKLIQFIQQEKLKIAKTGTTKI